MSEAQTGADIKARSRTPTDGPASPPPQGPNGDEEGGSDDSVPGVAFIDPRRVTVRRLPGGTCRATIEGDRSLLRATFSRAFPISRPGCFIEIIDGGGESVGMLKHLDGMDAASARTVAASLEQKYFVPHILEIYQVREEFGSQFWSVRTDRGEVEFYVKDPRRNLRTLPPRRVQITDVDDNRYEIPDIGELPLEDRVRLEKVI